MNCQNCGANVDGKAFCSQCGAPVNQQVPVQAPYNAIPYQQTLGNPTKVLVFCIVGLALCWTGVLGLIFSIVGLVQANRYIAQYGNVANQVRIGKILSIVGLAVSIFFIILWIFYIIFIVFMVSSYSSAYRGGVYYRTY